MMHATRREMKPIWRWLLGIGGLLSLCLLGLAYAVNRGLRIKYFHDFGWHGLSVTDSMWLVASIYFVLAGIVGRWKPT